MSWKNRIENSPISVIVGVAVSSALITAGVTSFFWKQQIEITEQKIGLLDEKLTAKDDAISDLKSDILERKEKSEKLLAEIKERDLTISTKNNEINDLDKSRQKLVEELQVHRKPKTIKVSSATYGYNKKTDVKWWFSSKCDGKTECAVSLSPQSEFSDPQVGVAKRIDIAYLCTGVAGTKSFNMPPFGEPRTVHIRLVCP